MLPAPAKPWSIAVFEQLRSPMVTFVRTEVCPVLDDAECRIVIVRAPVKSGKREIAEYIAMRDAVGVPTRIHAFISAWHRTADEGQREELGMQNMRVFSITTQKKVTTFLSWVAKQIEERKEIVLHLDECDHGSGSKQMLSKLWAEVRDIREITNILYSATPEEVLFSGEVEDPEYQGMMNDFIPRATTLEYVPAADYCGAARFLDAGLINEAKPFFYEEGLGYVLSPQGKTIVRDLRACIAIAPSRNILVLRLSYSELGGKRADIKKNKAIYQFLANIGSFPELSDFNVVVDKGDDIGMKHALISTEKIQWSSSAYWRRQATHTPTLLVVDQTSSRSTEWACHDRIFATHDFRNKITYSTISQAQERINHYKERYGGFQPIVVYGHMRTFLLSAKRITYTQFLEDYAWEKRKVDLRTSRGAILYRVRSTSVGHALHPECPESGMPEEIADRLLQELGCFADMTISQRVTGGMRKLGDYVSHWRKVEPETWDTFWPSFRADPTIGMAPADGLRTQNPFVRAADRGLIDGKWQGYRNGPRVLDYDVDIAPKPGCGMGYEDNAMRINICYKGGVLGVAIIRCRGTRMVNTLAAYKSMYKR